jgi:hypothetical protein
MSVPAGHVRILDLDVALPGAAEDDPALVDALRLPVPREHRHFPLHPELVG